MVPVLLTAPILELSWLDVLLAAALLVLTVGISLAVKLRLERELLRGLQWTLAKLALVGIVLRWIFQWDAALVVLLTVVLLLLGAAWAAFRRVTLRVPGTFRASLLALSLGTLATGAVVLYAIVGIDPWYAPRYVLPLFALLLGNAMTGVAVGLDRLHQELQRQRDTVELLLSLGATRFQAARDPFRRSLRAALTPTLGGLTAVAAVFLPGMLTGQLLAGVEPLLAVRYQIVVVFTVTVCVALSSALALLLVARACFTGATQLRV